QYLASGNAGWKDVRHPGPLAKPVSVVRLAPGGTRLRFHLDPLPTSTYIVRMIGVVEPRDVLEYPKDLIVDMTINDGPGGERSHYILRNRGTDNFYPVGEFYFRVVDGRPFDVEVGVHAESQVELLVHNVEVHDVLAECARRAG